MGKLFWHVRISVVRMCGTTAGNFRRMLNEAVSSHIVHEPIPEFVDLTIC
jgi:hypothetical protein